MELLVVLGTSSSEPVLPHLLMEEPAPGRGPLTGMGTRFAPSRPLALAGLRQSQQPILPRRSLRSELASGVRFATRRGAPSPDVEFLQVPLFDGMSQAPHWEAVKRCLRAAIADAAITLLAFWIVAAGVHSRDWVVRPAAATVLLFTAAGVTVTVLIEWLALSGAWYEGWAYAPQMPIVLVLGVGLAPLLQWTVIPPLVLWLVHRQLGPGRPS